MYIPSLSAAGSPPHARLPFHLLVASPSISTLSNCFVGSCLVTEHSNNRFHLPINKPYWHMMPCQLSILSRPFLFYRYNSQTGLQTWLTFACTFPSSICTLSMLMMDLHTNYNSWWHHVITLLKTPSLIRSIYFWLHLLSLTFSLINYVHFSIDLSRSQTLLTSSELVSQHALSISPDLMHLRCFLNLPVDLMWAFNYMPLPLHTYAYSAY